MSLRTSSALAARRAWLALLVSLAMGFNLTALHDSAAERSGPTRKVEIAESAIHPGDPIHFEASDIKTHHGCPGCLVQLETGMVPASRLSIVALVRGPAFAVPAPQAAAKIALLSGPARAPPPLSCRLANPPS